MESEVQALGSLVRTLNPMELDSLEKTIAEERWRRGASSPSPASPGFAVPREAHAEQRLSLAGAACETDGGMLARVEELSLENVEDAFTYHPWDAAQREHGAQVREALVAAAKTILRTVRRSPLRTRALNLLVDARMVANAAITHNGRF